MERSGGDLHVHLASHHDLVGLTLTVAVPVPSARWWATPSPSAQAVPAAPPVKIARLVWRHATASLHKRGSKTPKLAASS